MFDFPTLPSLSLYIHFPWCVQKCPYCDFNSHAISAGVPEQDYVNALLKDLEQDLPLVWGRKIQSIFMGGGTPSVFSASSIETLLSGIRARIALRSDIEITLEANPGTAEQNKFAAYRDLGINRLSIGIQSFDELKLKRLGRIHDAKEAVLAIESAHRAGFDNINLDLMYGLPNQTCDEAMDDISRAIQLEPNHISWYQLTLEPNTRFYHDPPQLPIEEQMWQMQQAGQAELASGGYRQYEVSAYARTGRQCNHNLNYWKFGDYLGIGAGAHGKISMASDNSIRRLAKYRSPKTYLQSAGSGDCISSSKCLTPEDAVLEFMMNAFRLNQGFSPEEFREHTGLDISVCDNALNEAMDKNLIEVNKEQIKPSKQGRLYLNNLLELFMV